MLLTFWETIDRPSLEVDLDVLYSYLNDIVSILTLLSSCLRFPVYCACNRLIYTASKQTFTQFRWMTKKDVHSSTGTTMFINKNQWVYSDYSVIADNTKQETPTSDVIINGNHVMGVIYDEKLQEWKL